MNIDRIRTPLIFTTLALLTACRLPIVQTLPRWPDGAIDLTRHAPIGDAAYDTAFYRDGLIRYPIWHRLNDSVFAIGGDTIKPPEAPMLDSNDMQLGAAQLQWFTHYDSLGVYRVRYELHDSLVDGTWIQLENATQILARPDSNCDWQETLTTIPAIEIPKREPEEKE